MRHLSFAKKDLAAIYKAASENKKPIKNAAKKKILKLGLKVARKAHGKKFEKNDLVLPNGRPVDHSLCVADVLAYIENVEAGDTDYHKESQANLCKIYLLC